MADEPQVPAVLEEPDDNDLSLAQRERDVVLQLPALLCRTAAALNHGKPVLIDEVWIVDGLFHQDETAQHLRDIFVDLQRKHRQIGRRDPFLSKDLRAVLEINDVVHYGAAVFRTLC